MGNCDKGAAAGQSRQVEVVYRTPGTKPLSRKLDPYHAVRYEGDWYIVAYCHMRNEIRTFSLSRIRQARETGETFQVPDDFDFHRLAGSHFGVH